MTRARGSALARALPALLVLLVLAAMPVRHPTRVFAAERDPRGPHELFFAEGTTREGYHEYLCLANGAGSEVTVGLEYMLEAGEPWAATVIIPALSRATVDVNAEVGPGHDVSVRAHSDSPFTAERPVYFGEGGSAGSSCAGGVPAASETWYFAEGYTGAGFREYICVQNPGASGAVVEAELCDGSGVVGTAGLEVPPRSRGTIDVGAVVGEGREVAARVRSTNGVPVVAERSMYFDSPGFHGGHCSAGLPLAASRFYFAEGSTRPGYQEYICVFNPGGAQVTVDAELLLDDGTSLRQQLTVPAGARRTLDVNAAVGPGRDVSAVLTSEGTFCAERPMYSRPPAVEDGHCSEGILVASRSWVFAEGTTRAGFRPLVCIGNPGDAAAEVTVEFLSDSAAVPVTVQVPARARSTVDPVNVLGTGRDFSTLVESTRPVVAERVQYCEEGSAYSGAHCAAGDNTWERGRFGDVRAYLNTYGEYAQSDLDDFERFDAAVLDPYDYPDESFSSTLIDRGTFVMAYIDVGEAEDVRHYWSEVQKHPEVILAENPDWPGCYYADVNNPEWHRIILEHEIPYLESLGSLDGLCLDMVDVVDAYPQLKPGMVSLMREIREWYPGLLLMPNRGFAVLPEMLPYIDAFKYEELSSRYDFDSASYVYEEDEGEQAVLSEALDRKDVPVMVLDHLETVPPDNTMASNDWYNCAEVAERTGGRFAWYANSVDQDRPYWLFIDYR
ncbi:MAG: endo alpha-1,4 polygalactosaminidase [Actinobacteria bacterium]|nr:endo alpha-1,4 polygalactosaminidase [Actinomycetota bacterium]MBU2687777.1 endo alpha-1,4 polygalactosaminidase [Actinomycetota bacterium]